MIEHRAFRAELRTVAGFHTGSALYLPAATADEKYLLLHEFTHDRIFNSTPDGILHALVHRAAVKQNDPDVLALDAYFWRELEAPHERVATYVAIQQLDTSAERFLALSRLPPAYRRYYNFFGDILDGMDVSAGVKAAAAWAAGFWAFSSEWWSVLNTENWLEPRPYNSVASPNQRLELWRSNSTSDNANRWISQTLEFVGLTESSPRSEIEKALTWSLAHSTPLKTMDFSFRQNPLLTELTEDMNVNWFEEDVLIPSESIAHSSHDAEQADIQNSFVADRMLIYRREESTSDGIDPLWLYDKILECPEAEVYISLAIPNERETWIFVSHLIDGVLRPAFKRLARLSPHNIARSFEMIGNFQKDGRKIAPISIGIDVRVNSDEFFRSVNRTHVWTGAMRYDPILDNMFDSFVLLPMIGCVGRMTYVLLDNKGEYASRRVQLNDLAGDAEGSGRIAFLFRDELERLPAFTIFLDSAAGYRDGLVNRLAAKGHLRLGELPEDSRLLEHLVASFMQGFAQPPNRSAVEPQVLPPPVAP